MTLSRLRLLAIGMLSLAGSAMAQPDRAYTQEDLQPVHWAFSSFFGTGWYQIDNNRSVFVLRMPPRWTLRESEYREDGRQSGLELHFPVTIGVHDIDDLPGIIEPDNFGTVSFTPGVEFEIPVTADWYLRPFVQAGYGFDLSSSEGAWIYMGGVKSRYRFDLDRADIDILTNVYYAGYNSNNSEDDDISGILLGTEFTHRLGAAERGANRYSAKWHASYSRLSRKLNFIDPGEDTGFNSVDDFFTIGLAFTPPEGRWNFWLYKPWQLGLALEFSPEGDYAAIKFNSRSWFTR